MPAKKTKKLYFFFGTECPHCHDMDPLIERLEKEEGLKFEKLETWHNAKNAEKLKKMDTVGCGGVPFFYNEATEQAICGAVDYKTFKKWAKGE